MSAGADSGLDASARSKRESAGSPGTDWRGAAAESPSTTWLDPGTKFGIFSSSLLAGIGGKESSSAWDGAELLEPPTEPAEGFVVGVVACEASRVKMGETGSEVGAASDDSGASDVGLNKAE